MAAALRTEGNNQYVRTHDFQSDMSSSPNRQIRFQIDKMRRTVDIAICRLPGGELINTLHSSRVTIQPRATGDLRGSVFRPTTLDQMGFASAEAVLGSLKQCKVYPINVAPNGTVNSFTISY